MGKSNINWKKGADMEKLDENDDTVFGPSNR